MTAGKYFTKITLKRNVCTFFGKREWMLLHCCILRKFSGYTTSTGDKLFIGVNVDDLE